MIDDLCSQKTTKQNVSLSNDPRSIA